MSRFPSIYQIATESRSSVGQKFLTKDQREAQEELRAKFPFERGGLGGLVLPWYAEKRDMTAGTAGQGGNTIATEVPEIGSALRDNMVLERMGARVFGGLRADVNLPRALAGLETEWLSENAVATGTTITTGNLELSPKRVTAWIDVSWQLMAQGPTVEPFIRAELMGALAAEIQRKIIAGTGTGGQPTGILNTSGIGSVVGGANGAAPDYDDILALEYAVTNSKADRGNLGWLVSPLGRKKLRKTEWLTGSGTPIWPLEQASSLLGHAAGVTTSVPDNLTKGSAAGICSALAFVEMSEVILCLWGPGISVEAVRAGGHLTGKTRMVATAFTDGGLRTPTAAAAMLDALCA